MTNTALFALWGLWVAWGVGEEWRARRRLARIRHRILCGGVRGKSTLTRLVHAGLNAAGRRTLGRVTGDEPRLLLPDRSEIVQKRRGHANIREIRAFLLSEHARPDELDAVAVENMAVDPELQGIVARRFVRPTLQLFASDARDHGEVLPDDPAERAAALLEGFDPRAPILVSDYAVNGIFKEVAEARGFRAIFPKPMRNAPPGPVGHVQTDSTDPTGPADLADPADPSDSPLALPLPLHADPTPPLRPHIAPLVECALGALRDLGCLTPEAREAVFQCAAALQSLTVYRLGDSAWVDLLSANDPDSTRRLMADVLTSERATAFPAPRILFAHRRDRPLRLEGFAPLFGEFDSVVVGDRVARRRAARLGAAWSSIPLPEDWTRRPNLVFLTGNTGGAGKNLRARLAAEGRIERW